jgi:peptide chain release factor 1
VLLLPRDPTLTNRASSRSGAVRGGEEAALFAAALYRMYRMYAEARGWRVEGLSAMKPIWAASQEVSF